MPLTAHGTVIYGFQSDKSFLTTEVSLKERICPASIDTHTVVSGKFCPECGSKIITKSKTVASQLVSKYANSRNISLLEASYELSKYHHIFDIKGKTYFLFGIEILNTASLAEIKTDSVCKQLIRIVFENAGLNPDDGKYYLCVETI